MCGAIDKCVWSGGFDSEDLVVCVVLKRGKVYITDVHEKKREVGIKQLAFVCMVRW